MSEILWLASYPKSGNTWLRMFLYNVFFPDDAPFDIGNVSDLILSEPALDLYEAAAGGKLDASDLRRVHSLRPRVQQALANRHPGTVFVKTHSAIAMVGDLPTISPAVTAGAIYVVRNPLDVCISYADHYGESLDEAIRTLNNKENIIATQGRQVVQVISSWSDHVKSWTTAPGLTRHVVRYEDLLDDAEAAFQGVVDFLGLDTPKDRILRAIEHSSFRELRRQEDEKGFRERSPSSSRFFRVGRAGQWREVLSREQVRALVDHNREQMQAFSYLDELDGI